MSKEILIVGAGAREHAMVWLALNNGYHPRVIKGNAGIAEIADCFPIEPTDIPEIIKIAKQHKSTIIVGPENPIALGIADVAIEEGLGIYAPTKKAHKVEWSKGYAKKIMREAGILTADFDIFSKRRQNFAHQYIDQMELPIVVKGDGLAFGKDVVVAKTYEQAHVSAEELLQRHPRIVIEKCLFGQEFSLMALCSGLDYLPLPASADTKPLYPGGPNTGGVGVYARLSYLKQREVEQYYEDTIGKLLWIQKKKGINYKGTLYPNIMKTKRGAEVLEFNGRFGDPEFPALARLAEFDFIEALELTIDDKIKEIKPRWSDKYVVNVVLVSSGYPDQKLETGYPIMGIEKANKLPGVLVFHAGTGKKDGHFTNEKGRVLDVTAAGKTPEEAQRRAYEAVNAIDFEGKTYNKTIGDKNIIR